MGRPQCATPDQWRMIGSCGRLCRLWLLGVLLIVASSACSEGASGDGPGEADRQPTPVVVDTDLAFADLLAVMFLLERPEVDVLAVTGTGTGIGRCPEAGVNNRAIMDQLGAEDVPFACGRRAPVDGFNTAPSAWRDAADNLAGVDLPDVDIDEDGAVDLLLRSVNESDRPVTILVTGPLTNLALALDQDPDVVQNIEEVIIMGGAVDVGGNILSFTNFVAEFNIWIDPVAAKSVFAAEVAITLVPLDATNAVPITPYFEEVFRTYRDASVGAGLIADHNEGNPLSGGQYHWDDLAAAVLIDRSLFTFEQIPIRVITESEDALGQTARSDDGRPVDVALAVDGEGYEQLFYETMIDEPVPDVPRWSADASIRFDGESCTYDGPDPLPAELTVETDNTSDHPVFGVLVGKYDEGTTPDQVASFLEDPPNSPPSFFTIAGIGTLYPRSVAVWTFRDVTDHTIWCAPADMPLTEIGGVRLLGD